MVALPIGNLKDITLRALEVLNSVDLILSEDTRAFLRLKKAYNLKPIRVESFYKEVESEKEEKIISYLREGLKVALCSEAGTPLLSDPGASLVKRALIEGIKVVPIPGPSALTTALSVCGFDLTQGFIFVGFLPKKEKEIQQKLSGIPSTLPLVTFIPPHRFSSTLRVLYEIFGDREVCLARELTKVHEEICRTTLGELIKRAENEEIKGEITLVIEGKREAQKRNEISTDEITKLYEELRKSGLKKKEIAQAIAKRLGTKPKEIYEILKKF